MTDNGGGESLDTHRDAIDRCDREIVRLINERARSAREIGRIKRERGESIYAPHREQAVYDKVTALNDGPLPDRAIRSIYREIMSGAIALEGATRIAYLGPPGTFSHEAAIEKFGSSMEYIDSREIRDVFLAVSRGHADYGVVPIENSTEGSVTQTSDMFMESDLSICSEIYLPIHLNLMARCELGEITSIASHPQPLAQCRNWLAANRGMAEVTETISTTAAARLAADKDGVAAVGCEAAAAIYGLNVLERCIEDRSNNVTRFVILGHEISRPTGKDRTSVLFSLGHTAGSLYDALFRFKERKVNLTRIESRPNRRRAWEYTFLVDMEGHIEDENIRSAVDALRSATHDLKVLGSYPRAEQVRQVARSKE